MNTDQVLTIVEKLHVAANHPDVVDIHRYGRNVDPGGPSPAGVALRFTPGSEAYIWADPGKPTPRPADLPEVVPPPRYRAELAIRFLIRLLDAAKPTQFVAWRTVSFPDVGPQVSGVELKCADGTSVWLRVTAAGGQIRDPEVDQFPDYVIPEGISV